MSISDAESEVMKALWAAGEATAEDLITAVAVPQHWGEATVRTLINRLLPMGARSAEREGRRYRYRPVLSHDQWLAQQSSGVLERLFGGRVAPLVAHFSQQGKLTRRDVEELRKLIEDFDDGR
ncbi:MAG: BlaI/MecI/CopY family transcriptional regulator [Arenimonas sp.]|uniref:BlaI/MecI/CopY family transcriptional regulator n=1 Tax=Arenimonas sp. TaxID=1872635 RepID=UPI0025C2F4A8|nr:BlaI/MecI/CopY family transcriptional regulator [Arenimonas sp.]MBW8366239.1 BlaI/MecI/CopY family transcriptional regulator [Arenimonas sp.]